MGLAKGTRLGHYEVLELIGKGGMGEVYRGYDTQLKRDVALKVLPEAFARDRERLARFRREATLLASLNHPNIAAIYRLEQSGDTVALVMEYVPGETLAGRILREGPVPVEESLDIARQICDALEHAHEKTVVHRDLKPANVKLTPEGRVKVLDFGLAKAFASDPADDLPNSQAPTISPGLSPTIPGAIIGTAAYMSPEQARGKVVDKRADIFALGCVLFELLTGKQAFAGESITDTLGAVLHKELDWSLLPAATPPGIRALLRRCLTKDAGKRLRSAADVSIAIDDTLAAPAMVVSTLPQAPALRRWLMYAAVACVAAAIAGLAVWNLKPTPPKPITRTVIALPPDQRLVSTFMPLALSPDGSHLVYVAQRSGGPQQLYFRAMDSLEATPLSGTEGASTPFFSPDGQWIGFFNAGNLRKVSIGGGAVLTLCSSASGNVGASWGTNGRIIFAQQTQSGLSQVSAAGGAPEVLTQLGAGETTHRWPEFLPGGKAVLVVVGAGGNYDNGQIVVLRLDTGEHKVLIQGGTFPHYVPTGHIVYYRAGTIMAVPFDLKRLEVTGSPAPVMEGVMSTSTTGSASFSVAGNGALAYVPGGTAAGNQTALVWVDRKGGAEPLKASGAYTGAPSTGGNGGPRLSPDGQQIAVQLNVPKSDIWIYSLARDTLTRLTFEGSNSNFIWTRDGKRVVYESVRQGDRGLFWKAADGSGAEERLTTSQNTQYPGAFTPDGRTLLYLENDPKTQRDLWVLPLDGDRKPRVLLQTQFNETAPRISPDGKWVAYLSDESGRYEVYVQPYPGPGGKYQISTEGGREMVWGENGEIFYRNGDKMMAVEVKTQPSFVAGKPQVLFEGNYLATTLVPWYDVTPDGKRFLMMKAANEQSVAAATQINVVQNWFEELKKKVPVK